jgi:hypothetical protein
MFDFTISPSNARFSSFSPPKLNNPSHRGISKRQDTPENLQDDAQSLVLSRCSDRIRAK